LPLYFRYSASGLRVILKWLILYTFLFDLERWSR